MTSQCFRVLLEPTRSGVPAMGEHEESLKNEENSKTCTPTTVVSPLGISEPVTSDSTAPAFIRKQHLASFLANMPSFSSGIAMGWSAPAVPVLLGDVDDSTTLRLTLEQASWAVAIFPLASLAGALMAAYLCERLGRKGALLAGAVPTLLGWLCVTFAGSLWVLLVGRALTGVVMGTAIAPATLYCEEVADVRVRGALGTYQFVMTALGSVWIYGFGGLLPYFWFTALSLVPSLLFLVTFVWLPESPAFLAARCKRKAAHASLRWFRGLEVDCDVELDLLLASKAKTVSSEENKQAQISFLSVWTRRPWKSNSLRSVAILLALMFFQQMTGIALFSFYTVQVFQEAGGSVSSHLCTFIMGVVTTLSGLLATGTIDRFGRRTLLLISFALMGTCLLCMSVYSYFKINDWISDEWRWVPLALLILYFILFGLSVGPVPWCLMAEMLPMYAKGWASSIAVCVNRVTLFVVAKQSPLMLEYAGEIPTYTTFGAICFLGTIYVAMCVPETKGKSKAEILQEIGGDEP